MDKIYNNVVRANLKIKQILINYIQYVHNCILTIAYLYTYILFKY